MRLTRSNVSPAACLVNVEDWMSTSRLRLNSTKTQVMWLGSKHQLSKITNRDVTIISSTAHAVDTSRDLGVMVDSRLTMADQVDAISRGAYYQLRQLRSVTRSLSPKAAKTVVQAFITSRLDYCNSLLYGITDSLFRRLQSVQNAAARFISSVRRSDHIMPVLRQLHWLPVRQRVQYKLTLLVYESLRGLTPLCLSDECQLATVGGRRELRSADVITCHVPRT